MEASSGGGVPTTLALMALGVFLLIPNRFLSLAYWGLALLLLALVLGPDDDAARWPLLLAGTGCIVGWFYKRASLKNKREVHDE